MIVGVDSTKGDRTIDDLCLQGGRKIVTDNALVNVALDEEAVNDSRDNRIRHINQGILCQDHRPETKDTISIFRNSSFRNKTNRLLVDHDTSTDSESVSVQSS